MGGNRLALCSKRKIGSPVGLSASGVPISLEGASMRIGASLFLIAVGAVLKFAVTAKVNGVDVGTVGIILMIVGIIGLIITLALMSTRRRTDVIHSRTGTTVIAPGEPIDPVDPRY
jgi:uncharacterized YccA/Bax inhibitor family protein